ARARKNRARLRPARPRDSRCVGHPEAVRRLHRAGRKRNMEHPDLRPGYGAGDPPDHQARARQHVSLRRRDVSSPNEWDAIALTFAEPVAPRSFARQIKYPALGRWYERRGHWRRLTAMSVAPLLRPHAGGSHSLS